MQQPSLSLQPSSQNLFLTALPDDERQRIAAQLELVTLSGKDSIYMQDSPIDYIYFPLDCIISSLLVMNDGATVEVGMIGKEAVVGITAIFGEHRMRNWTRTLVPGHALRLRSEVVREMFRRSQTTERLLMCCYRAMVTQISQRAVCNGRHTMLHRLATWLLMVHDRLASNNLPLTQEIISGRLGSRRASVTQAACHLQNIKAISYSRGKIHIEDRDLIETEACECYEVIKKEFDSLKNSGGGAQKIEQNSFRLAIRTRLRDIQ
ncbi:MAG TPA: Crp/Fnr family transcriptional regulator [Pyrinomonadaceae bacterium]